MIASPKQVRMTAEEYLAWEARQEVRHEYCDGEVFAMAGGTKGHDEIAFNLRRSLIDRVEQQDYNMSGSDVKVMTNEGRSYRYPDLSVSCDKRDRENDSFYEFPKLIVEVLSSSTESADRDEKFQEYIQIPTLEEYVLVNAKRMQVECYRRGEGRMWLYFPYKEGDRVEIDSLNIEIPIEQIYKNVRLEKTSNSSEVTT